MCAMEYADSAGWCGFAGWWESYAGGPAGLRAAAGCGAAETAGGEGAPAGVNWQRGHGGVGWWWVGRLWPGGFLLHDGFG